jgi:type IV pilus biogenesis protein CpaD/CtpE
MMKRHVLLMLVMVVANWGCAPQTPSNLTANLPAKVEFGKPIDMAKYDQVIEKKTTEAETIALLGTPDRVMEMPDGIKALMYSDIKMQLDANPLTASSVRGVSSDTIVMFIVKGGKVVKKTKSVGSHPVSIDLKQR